MAEITPSTFSATAPYSANDDAGTGLYPLGASANATVAWAADGINSTAETFWGCANASGNYVEFDLGSSKDVARIDVLHTAYPSEGWNASYTNGAALQYYNGSSWVTIATLAGHTDGGGAVSYTMAVTAQNFRIYKVGTGYLALGDMRFYEPNLKIGNVSPLRPLVPLLGR